MPCVVLFDIALCSDCCVSPVLCCWLLPLLKYCVNCGCILDLGGRPSCVRLIVLCDSCTVLCYCAVLLRTMLGIVICCCFVMVLSCVLLVQDEERSFPSGPL